MKKMSKLTRKLLLSALALAVAVVTLTTTTYAWYTSSTTAKAGSGEATTSGTTSDSSLMISKDGDEFGTTVNIGTKATSLIPLQWSNGKFVDKEGNDTDEITENSYYEFVLYFKSTTSDKVPVYISSVNIDNKVEASTDLPKYDNLVYDKGVTGAPEQKKYSVDVVSALDMVLTTGDYNPETKLTSNEKTTSYALDLEGLDPVGFGASINANAYYDKFMNASTVDTAASYNRELEALNGNVKVGEISESGILAITFRIYLNGWDNYAFDACRGQSFTVELTFASKPVTPVVPDAE